MSKLLFDLLFLISYWISYECIHACAFQLLFPERPERPLFPERPERPLFPDRGGIASISFFDSVSH